MGSKRGRLTADECVPRCVLVEHEARAPVGPGERKVDHAHTRAADASTSGAGATADQAGRVGAVRLLGQQVKGDGRANGTTQEEHRKHDALPVL